MSGYNRLRRLAGVAAFLVMTSFAASMALAQTGVQPPLDEPEL